MKRVAILGAGPSGLLAAHAAQTNGCEFTIFSKKRYSQLFGSQYLHEPISGITTLPERVSYVLNGDPEEYRRKVYGADWDGNVSPEDLEQDHWAWNIREAYADLYARYIDYIDDVEFHNISQTILECGLNRFDVVLSTVPRTIWREPGDQFLGSKVWAIGDAPSQGQYVPFRPAEDFMVLCDGTSDVSWYRLSRVFGFTTIEWPYGTKPPVEGIQEVIKPLSCKTKSAQDFVHLGRYGKWEKGVLSTDAYNEALVATANA